MISIIRSQQGSATLTALIMMMLVTLILASIVWQEHLVVRQIEYARDQRQAEWLHIAATDFARFVLANDSRTSTNDYLGEAWSMPLAETKIADFLRGIDIPKEIRHVSLAGQISDAQGRLNLNNLIDNATQAKSQSLAIFQRLLENTGTDPSIALQVHYMLNQSGLRFTDPAQLAGFPGFTESVLQRIRASLIALPESTRINANTASSEILRAAYQGMTTNQASEFIAARMQNPLKSDMDIRNLLTRIGVPQAGEPALTDVKSNYFIVRTEIGFGDTLYVGQSTIRRATAESESSGSGGLTQIISTRFFSTFKE